MYIYIHIYTCYIDIYIYIYIYIICEPVAKCQAFGDHSLHLDIRVD